MPLDLDKKLATARTKLILEKPFLGALVLRLPMVRAKDDWCDTTFSNGKKLYYNEHYIDALSPEQTQFALAHEALHCALSHFARRQNRVKHRWDMACDFAINPMLINDGLTPPVDALYLREYADMTAEEIYPCLEDNDNDQERELEQELNPDSDNDEGEGGSGDQHDQKEGQEQKQKGDKGQGEEDGGAREDNSDTGDGDGKGQRPPDEEGEGEPDPLTPQEIESLSLQWQQRMASAAQQAIQAGKLGGSMARMVDHLLQPKLPWRMLLARYMTMVARDDYTYSRPSSRRGDPVIYPSLRSSQLNIVIALDISGSISDKEIGEFISEIDAIKSQLRARITLLACDSKLAEGGPWMYESWEEFVMPEKFHGGGGTSFKPVIEWADEQDQAPDLIVYFTDAQGEFPEQEPAFPVIWLVKGKTPVPWGQRVQLN
ncbi:MAG: VWA-like domain-containing protein [Gammaproteobacteria bacterium]|nr:VWA-like domain-containing protein [Gammaproteobacteria bacterium]